MPYKQYIDRAEEFEMKPRKEEPELSKETIKDIEAARQRIKKGHFVTLNEVKKRLGL